MTTLAAKINSPHSFYIPVMGTGFTIDTPLKVAKYGISSVISLVDDVLIEQMRKFWCEKFNEPYEEIKTKDDNSRAKRITAYLNLLWKLIKNQLAQLKENPFEPNSDITKYYELIPNGTLKETYHKMLAENDPAKKLVLQDILRQAITIGSIDVNIMTKLDRPHSVNGQTLPYEFYDAASALRGYAESELESTIIFSAGFNPRLYGYLANFPDFFPNTNGEIKKKICLKVSDYRSAEIQGKYLAKHGLWVSEYRIESPINCGGHAFITDGQLLGPILEEFKQRKNELLETLLHFYKKALANLKNYCVDNIPEKIRITAQGGIGTSEEHNFLIHQYELDAAGWGTPFLLVPEATNVDAKHIDKLINAKDDQVALSQSSPLGIPFWNLLNSDSEEMRRERIKNNKPGSSCIKGFLKTNCDFTVEPICTASREYQKHKLEQLESNKCNLSPNEFANQQQEILAKSCICHDLAGGATIKENIDPNATTAICPGPNILNFKKIMSLKEMSDHIYGRCSLLTNKDRPHMFIAEIKLYINYLLNEIKKTSSNLPNKSQQTLNEIKENLSKGINYYQTLVKDMFTEQRDKMLHTLQKLQKEIETIIV
jgi:hypothetical protein